MGVCCSKDKVVKVNENVAPTDKNLLISENVGKHKKVLSEYSDVVIMCSRENISAQMLKNLVFALHSCFWRQ